MKQWDTGDWIAFVLVVLIIAGFLAWAVYGIRVSDIAKREGRECVSAGYADRIEFNKAVLCIGVVDGAYAVEPVDDVRARLGQDGKGPQ